MNNIKIPIKITVLLTILFLSVTISLSAQSITDLMPKLDPALKWKSIKTKHFWIHYHQKLENIAHRLSIIAENVHVKLSKKIRWEPALRTDVVLIDSTDLANGFATPIPYNRIQIYIARPGLDSVLNNFDDWLELVFIHEYTHILNIDTVSWLPSITRYVPGRFCFPNMFLPIWAIEGNAVYHESESSNFGRNNSTYTDMIMRTEVLTDNFKPISKASNFPREWPKGRVPYLYGGLFIKFLEEKYGEGTVADYFHENSDNIIPYSDNMYKIPFINSKFFFNHFYNKDAKDIFNRTFPELWKDWEKYVKTKYNHQIKKINKEGITESQPISDEKINSLIPRFSQEGKSIYYIKLSDKKDNVLVKYNLSKKIKKNLCRVNYPGTISVSSKGNVFISDLEYYHSFSEYYEVFKYSKGYEQITSRLRAAYFDIFNNGKKSIFIKNDSNRYSLIISDTNFKNQAALIDKSNIQLAFIRLSPDNKKAVFTIKDKKGFTDIVLLDLESKTFYRLTNDLHINIHPAWNHDGTKIIYSSDKNGIYNLYEYNLKKNRINRITNLLGGAFNPDLSPDGKTIVFSSYKSNGHVISLMKYPKKIFSSENAKIEKLEHQFFSQDEEQDNDEYKTNAEDYNPLYSVIPSIHMPLVLVFTEEFYPDKYDYPLGFLVSGADTLFRHYYQVMSLAYIKQKRVSIDVQYQYSGLYPDVIIGYSDNTLFFDDDKFPWGYDDQITRILYRQGYLTISFPFTKFNYYQNLRLSYIFGIDYTDEYDGSDISSERDTLARINALYYFTNAREYSYSISKEHGRDFFITADIYRNELGSDLSFYRTSAEYAEYLPGFTTSNVTMLRVRGGISINNPDYLSPFTLGKFKKGNIGIDYTGVGEWGLRGYPAGKIYGNRLTTLTAAYRFPILQSDSAFHTFPVMFRDMWINLFYDFGNVWDGSPNINQFKSSVGIELNLNFTMGYKANLAGYIGYARGFNQYGEKQIYFAISTLYGGAFKKNP